MATQRYSFLAEPGASGSGFVLDLDESRTYDRIVADFGRAGKPYEPDVSAVLAAVLREGDTFVDVGAHIGFFTLMAARLVGPAGRVVAFEPDPFNVARLRAHAELNGCGNVTVIEQPASHRAEEVEFFINSDDRGGNALWDPGRFPANVKSQAKAVVQRVRATTLDAERKRLALDVPKLIKIDTEGAETRVLEGARELLAGAQVPFIIAEHHVFGLEQMGSSPERLRALMEDAGYSAFTLSYSGALPKLVPPATRIESPYFVNLLFSTVDMVGSYWPVESVDPRQG